MEKLRAEKQDILIKIHADCSHPSHPALVSPGGEENLFFFFRLTLLILKKKD